MNWDWKKWIVAALVRALKTFAQTFASMIVVGATFDEIDCGYVCPCSRERTDRALLAMGKKELTDMIRAPEKEFTVHCQFCDRIYRYTKADLQSLIEGGR